MPSADHFKTTTASGHSLGSTPSADRRGPCYWCFRAIKWIPVLFIVAVIGWSYYAYVIQLCFLSVETLIEQLLFLFFYHIVFLMFVWSYWQTVFTAIGRVPSKFRIPRSEMERLSRAESQETQRRILEVFAKDLPISNRTLAGSLRYCEKCMLIKPDRAHHCSVCGTCVLKMDHHCPWVNNCVNFTNYKYFVLFLGYALLYCIYVALTVLRYFIMFWEGQLEGGVGRFHILFLFFVAVMFAISLVSLFGYHIYLVALNRTTLEAFRTPIFRIGGPDKNGFNLGRYNNIQEVFGDNRKLWFLPVFTSFGDGVLYPVLSKHLPENGISPTAGCYESMGNSMALNNCDDGNDDEDGVENIMLENGIKSSHSITNISAISTKASTGALLANEGEDNLSVSSSIEKSRQTVNNVRHNNSSLNGTTMTDISNV